MPNNLCAPPDVWEVCIARLIVGKQSCCDDCGSSPEDAGVVILRVEALVGGDHAVEQPLAGVEAAQALDQPSVS